MYIITHHYINANFEASCNPTFAVSTNRIASLIAIATPTHNCPDSKADLTTNKLTLFRMLFLALVPELW